MLPEEKKWPQALSSCNPSRRCWKTRLLVKITEPGKAFMPDGKLELPYEGGKPMLRVERLEDRAFLKKLVRMTCEALPEPKKKR